MTILAKHAPMLTPFSTRGHIMTTIVPAAWIDFQLPMAIAPCIFLSIYNTPSSSPIHLREKQLCQKTLKTFSRKNGCSLLCSGENVALYRPGNVSPSECWVEVQNEHNTWDEVIIWTVQGRRWSWRISGANPYPAAQPKHGEDSAGDKIHDH